MLTVARYICTALARLSQSAFFNFSSLLLVILLSICTCTYIRAAAPGLVDRNKNGPLGMCFKAARIGGCMRTKCRDGNESD